MSRLQEEIGITEAGVKMPSVSVNTSKCSGCGKCVDICPEKVFELVRDGERLISKVAAEDRCFACMACALKCPQTAITVTGYEIRKVDPPPDYPPEEGRYIRGNDYSPVAVVAILDTYDFKIPRELVRLLEIAIEAGAALAGTLQTENIGIEKIIANIVANPNIRYIVLCWRESQGHMPADALINLVKNGVANDKRRTIIGARAPAPYLPNISLEAIERFRKQVTIVNLISEEDPKMGMDPENVRRAVWACIQEKPTEFMGYILYDPGAWPEPPICQRISWRITEPWRPEYTPEEAKRLQYIKEAAREKSERERKRRSYEELLEFLGIKRA